MKSQSCHHPFRLHTIPGFLTAFVACAIGLSLAIATPTLQISPTGTGQLQLTLQAGSGTNYLVQSSTDLVKWTLVSSPSPSGLILDVPQNGPATFYRAISQEIATGTFKISTTNLTANVGPGFFLWEDGSVTTFGGGQIQLFPNFTNYIVLNLGTLNLHCLSRSLGDDSVLLGVVNTGSTSSIATIQSPVIAPPTTRISSFKNKLLNSPGPVVVAEIGDSLTAGAGSGYLWWDLLFNTNRAGFGLNVLNAGNVRQINYGVGGQIAEYGQLLLGNAYWNEPNSVAGWQEMSLLFDQYFTAGSTNFLTYPSGPSTFFDIAPDLTFLEFGVNSSPYSAISIENSVRILAEQGFETLMLTGNANNNNPAGNIQIGEEMSQLRQAYGTAVADTWAYVDEVNRRGTNTYFDVVHQIQIGWEAWAEAVLGVINPYSQTAASATIPSTRVLFTTNIIENPYLFDSADYVYLAADFSNISLESTSQIGANMVPMAFFPNSNQRFTYEVKTQGYITYGDEAWTAAYLLIGRGLGTNSFAADVSWIDCGSNLHHIRDINFQDSTFGTEFPFFLNLATISDILPAIKFVEGCGDPSERRYNNGGIRITVTNGTARVLGCVFYGPQKSTIPLERIESYGNWNLDQNDPNGFVPKLLFTDNIGDSLYIPFTGGGVRVILRRTVAGGQIDGYLDGVRIFDHTDTYNIGGYVQLHMNFYPPTIDGAPANPKATHAAILSLVGTSTNSVAPSSGRHRFNVVKVETLE